MIEPPAIPPELELQAGNVDPAVLRATLLDRGLAVVRGFASAEEIDRVNAHVESVALEESWSSSLDGRAIVERTRAMLSAAFGFVLLDPFRYERAPGHEGGSPRAEIKARWHRDNWPVTTRYGSDRRNFLLRPILLCGDTPNALYGPTEVALDSHTRDQGARWFYAEPRRLLLVGRAGDLWLMASRAAHRRAFAPAEEADPLAVRRVAWMVAKTEVPHP